MEPKIGRPSKFKPEFVAQVQKLCALGHTDKELAEFFGVAENTLYAWGSKHPEFLRSLKLGKEEPDDRVERSLFHRATGYSHEAVKIFCDPKTGKNKVIKFVEHYPPDTTACIFWLKNRRSAEWRDRIETAQVVSQDTIKASVDNAVQMWCDETGGTRKEALRFLGRTEGMKDQVKQYRALPGHAGELASDAKQ